MTPPRSEPPSKLEIEVKQNGRQIEALSARTDLLDQHLLSLTRSIEALTEQVARLTETSFETQNLLRESANRRDTQIDRLLTILERLIPPAPSTN